MMHRTELTDKEYRELYEQIDKSKLIDMLIECNRQINRLTEPMVIYPYEINNTDNYDSITK